MCFFIIFMFKQPSLSKLIPPSQLFPVQAKFLEIVPPVVHQLCVCNGTAGGKKYPLHDAASTLLDILCSVLMFKSHISPSKIYSVYSGQIAWYPSDFTAVFQKTSMYSVKLESADSCGEAFFLVTNMLLYIKLPFRRGWGCWHLRVASQSRWPWALMVYELFLKRITTFVLCVRVIIWVRWFRSGQWSQQQTSKRLSRVPKLL